MPDDSSRRAGQQSDRLAPRRLRAALSDKRLASAPSPPRCRAAATHRPSRPTDVYHPVGSALRLSAIELAARIRRKEVSAREVLTAHLARIERVNPKVNAIVTLVVAERAMADAARADELTARGGPLGVLHGLPVAHKDLSTRPASARPGGRRSTATMCRTRCADRDAHPRGRRDHVGKTNTPEFGAGSQTFNTVFGATRNPYDLTQDVRRQQRRRRGRRSRAAWSRSPTAATRAARCAIPAAFCNVVGFRPSPGRVPSESTARGRRCRCRARWRASVADVALFLSAIAGPTPRSPAVASTKTARDSARRSERELQGRARRLVAADSAAFRSSRRSARRRRATASVFETSAASSRRPSRISPASTRRSRPCASPRNHLAVRAAVRDSAGVGQGHDQVRGRGGGAD